MVGGYEQLRRVLPELGHCVSWRTAPSNIIGPFSLGNWPASGAPRWRRQCNTPWCVILKRVIWRWSRNAECSNVPIRKCGPIDKYIRSLSYKVVINCLGLSAEEWRSRDQLRPRSVKMSLTTRSRLVFNWLPSSPEDAAASPGVALEFGTPLHPIYVPKFHRDR